MPGRILIVDDYPHTAEILARWLKQSGRAIKTAADGLEALEIAEEFFPDLVLLDVELPTLSGFEVAKKLRQQPWGKNIIVIGVTGWIEPEERERAQTSGFDAFLLKPFDYAQLATLVRALFPSKEQSDL